MFRHWRRRQRSCLWARTHNDTQLGARLVDAEELDYVRVRVGAATAYSSERPPSESTGLRCAGAPFASGTTHLRYLMSRSRPSYRLAFSLAFSFTATGVPSQRARKTQPKDPSPRRRQLLRGVSSSGLNDQQGEADASSSGGSGASKGKVAMLLSGVRTRRPARRALLPGALGHRVVARVCCATGEARTQCQRGRQTLSPSTDGAMHGD